MIHLRKFNEDIETQDVEEGESAESNFTEVTDELTTMIEATIDNSGGEFKQFVESLLKNPDDAKIEGLINDSEIYDFYLKYRNQIDEMLNTINFYEKTSEELDAFGLYEYVIVGTKVAIEEFIKKLSE